MPVNTSAVKKKKSQITMVKAEFSIFVGKACM